MILVLKLNCASIKILKIYALIAIFIAPNSLHLTAMYFILFFKNCNHWSALSAHVDSLYTSEMNTWAVKRTRHSPKSGSSVTPGNMGKPRNLDPINNVR